MEKTQKKNPAKYFQDPKTRTSRLTRRLLLDSISGAIAAFTVSPILYIVDRAIVEKTAGKLTLPQSSLNTLKKMAKNPLKFIIRKDFLWIYLVYSTTYMTANSIDSLCKITNTNDIFPKLIGVTAVNMTTSILKDRAYAYYFGSKSGNKRVTAVSMAFWLVRDVLTMAGAFVIPSRLAAYLRRKGVEEEKSVNFSQFFCPVFFQTCLTPVHLLGYSYYEMPVFSVMGRFWNLVGIYPGAVFIRMIRMGGAYGVGGVNNRGLRNHFIGKYEGDDWDDQY